MLVTEEPGLQNATATALEREALHQVVDLTAGRPNAERVLPAIAELLVDAAAGHACCVYLREGDVLRLRAAAPADAHAVDDRQRRIPADEGLCGWVARHRVPAFGALDDPRVTPVPALADVDGFPSTVAVPLLDGDGREAVGVIALQVEAPRALRAETLRFLVRVASLVAGTLDTARLLEATRRQAAALAGLTQLTEEIASATRSEDLERVACAGVRRLLGADACRVEPVCPPPGDPRALVAALTAGGTDLGVLVAERDRPFDAEEERLLQAVGHQLALALGRAELHARLAAEHVVRDLFDALAEGRPQMAEARARAAGHDLDRRHVVAVLEPLSGEPDAGWPQVAARAEARLRRAVPGALCDAGDDRLRALLPLAGAAADAERELARIDAELARLAREERLAGGRGEPRSGVRGDQRGLAEAACAAQVARAVEPAGGARGYGALGVYRYLAQLPAGHAPDERHAQAIATLAAYDAKRRTELLATLERHLGDRGALAATARALYVHTNTLRQRLDRVEALTGLDLATEDLLSLELAIKLARLHGTP